jgi:DNA-binding MarR family transcriptional regulator
MKESLAYRLHKLVWNLDNAAYQLLSTNFGITYKRAMFLFALQMKGTLTQHELALVLGYSDPAVSTMLQELAREGYIMTTQSPEHARKRLVSLTPQGQELAAKGRNLLDSHFDLLMERAGIDAQQLSELVEKLQNTLDAKMKEK